MIRLIMRANWVPIPTAWTALLFGLAGLASAAMAAPGASDESDPRQATSSAAARQGAVQSIPIEKLTAESRGKVQSVLSNVTVFRRFPTRVVNCDPDLYLFLVRHPDVVVGTWEALGISQLQLRQTAPRTFRIVESEGTTAVIEYLYQSHDTHVLYGEWAYTGSLLNRTVHGRCLAILKAGYVREPDGRYYITNRLDGFLSVEPGGAEMLTKLLHPLVVRNADMNFVQSVAYVGSLSRTAEVNLPGMQRLSTKLVHVQPEVRKQLGEIMAGVADRAAALPPREETAPAEVARRMRREQTQ